MTTQCAAALSRHPIAAHASGEVIGEVLERLGGRPDLAVLFATTPHTGTIEDVAAAVRTVLEPKVLLGSTAGTVAGGAEEVEEEPGLSLFAARFDDGPPLPVRLEVVPTADGAAVVGLPDDAVVPGAPPRTLVLVPDPFSFPADQFVAQLNERAPKLTVVGGMASSARGPGGNRLVLDASVHRDGAVGALLPGSVTTGAVVSQGCRPIGEPMIVTRVEGNLIYELASEPALPRLLRLVESLPADDRALAARGLQIGRVVDERKATFGPGDFLIRSVLGADRASQAIAVGDQIDIGSTVQFQVRDAHSADDDLRALLAGRQASGALLFTCNGRGTHLFGTPDHDAALVDAVSGGATAGMSCAGELGPIGGRTELHGFTASILLFE